MTPTSLLTLTALIGVFVNACHATPNESASTQYAVEFQMMDDDGQALGGVAIDAGSKRIGATAASGLLEAELSGDEGQIIPVAVLCPEGFSNPDTLEPLRLTRTRHLNHDGYQPLRLDAVCRRRLRDVVIAVRAYKGGGLPLLVEGKRAGTTDSDGIAHVLVKVDRTTASVSVTLDTGAHPELKPKTPSRTFDLAGRDALLVFDQAFVWTPKRVLRASASMPKRHVPYRVD